MFKAGDHVPIIGVVFVDEVGSADKFAPEHIAETWVNVGVMGLVTFIVAVFEQPALFR